MAFNTNVDPAIINSINKSAELESRAATVNPLGNLGNQIIELADDAMKASREEALMRYREKKALEREQRAVEQKDKEWQRGAEDRDLNRQYKQAQIDQYKAKGAVPKASDYDKARKDASVYSQLFTDANGNPITQKDLSQLQSVL